MITQPAPLGPAASRWDRLRRRSLDVSGGSVAAIFVVALALLLVGLALGLYRYANSRIERIDIVSLGELTLDDGPVPDAPAEVAVEPVLDAGVLEDLLTILVVGTDSREGLTFEELERLGTEAIEDRNTDTLLLVQLSPDREAAAMVSFPRDLQVAVPDNGRMRINRVYDRGGPDLLVETVQAFTDVAIDHYIEVDLAGFIDMTEALGGVEVCLEEPMRDRYAGVDLPAGCQELDGFQASGFVRSRRVRDEFGPDNDYGRINRQHYFVRQAVSKMTSLGTLLNPVKVKALLDAASGAVRLDRDMDPKLLLRLANTLKGFGPGDIDQRVVPSYYSPDTGFVYEYPDQAELLFRALRDGRPLPDVGRTGTVELVPDAVRVQVRNASDVPGAEALAADALRGHGFEVGPVVTSTAPLDRTVVQYRRGDEPRALLVTRFVDARLEIVDDLPVNIDVVLLLGRDGNTPDPTVTTAAGPPDTTP